MATPLSNKQFSERASSAGTRTSPSLDPACVIKSTAVMEDTVDNVAAVTNGSEDAAAVAGMYTLLGDLCSQLDVMSLAACASLPSPNVLSLPAVKELLCAWQTTRGSLVTSWAAAVSRFQRLLLFSPRGNPGCSSFCHICIKTRTAVLEDPEFTNVTDRAARGVPDSPQPQAGPARGQLSDRRVCNPLLVSPRGEALAVTAKDSVTQQDKRLKAGGPSLAVAVVAPPRPRDTTSAAGGNHHMSLLSRCTDKSGEGFTVAAESNRKSHNSAINESKAFPQKYSGTRFSFENEGSANLRKQQIVRACRYEKTEGSRIVEKGSTSLENSATYAPPDADTIARPSPGADRQHVRSGLDLLTAFEGLRSQRRRAMWLQQTSQSAWYGDQELRRQLQVQIGEAVSRGMLLRPGGRMRKTLLDWEEPYLRDECIDINRCPQNSAQDAAAQAASENSAIASEQKAAPAASGTLSAVPRSQVTSQPAEALSLPEAGVGGPASLGGISGTRRAAADELRRHVAFAIRSEAFATDSSQTVYREVYRPGLAAAAAALEMNNARSCLEATADALLHVKAPPTSAKAEECSRVFCVLAEVDGSLLLMQQQQIDCLRRIYGRIQHVIKGFLNKTVRLASLQSADAHSCETLQCCECHRSSCNTVVTGRSSRDPVNDVNTRRHLGQSGAPESAALIHRDNDALCHASDRAGRAGNALATVTNTGTAAAVTSRFEMLLGLHVTCEVLRQKTHCGHAFFMCAKGCSDTGEAVVIRGRATGARSETRTSRSPDELTAAATDGRVQRLEGSAGGSKRYKKPFPYRNATNAHPNGESQGSSLLQAAITTSTAGAAGTRGTSLGCADRNSRGSTGRRATMSAKTVRKAPAPSDSLGGADTDLAAGEATTVSNDACSVSHSKSSNSRTRPGFSVAPQPRHDIEEEDNKGTISSPAPLLRRVALQRIQAVTAEILQSCGKLLQQLQYVDQAIQEALASSTSTAHITDEGEGNYVTVADVPAQGSALAPFLQPLELPSAVAALHAIGTLQEAIREAL